MASAPRTQRAPEWRNGDLGALSERVTGTEKQISDLAVVVDRMETGLSGQIRDLATIVQNQSTAFANARATNWPAVLATGAAMLGVVIIIGGSTLSPIYRSVDTLVADVRLLTRETVAKDEFKENNAEANRWLENLRDRVRQDEDQQAGERERAASALARLDERQTATDTALSRVQDELQKAAGKDDLREAISRTDDRINTAIAAFRQLITDVLTRPSSAGK